MSDRFYQRDNQLLLRLSIASAVVLPTVAMMALLQPQSDYAPLLAWLDAGIAVGIGWLLANRVSFRLAIAQPQAASDNLYRTIVEDQTEFIARILPDTTVVFVNDAYCRYFGVDRATIVGKNYTPTVYEADRERVAEMMRSMTIDNPTIVIENRVVVNGEVRWTQWVSRMLFDHQGAVIEIQSVGRDITELKRVEESLREGDARFRQLAETVQEGFFIFETEAAQYSYLNLACMKISGIPTLPSSHEPLCLRGMNHWFSNIHPADRDRIAHALEQERQGKEFNEEYRFIRPDGELHWLRSKAFPLQDEVGNVVRVVGIVEDITDRKQLELALQRSEAKLKNLLDSANASIASFCLDSDQNWEYDYWSEGCEVVFGYTAQEFLAEPTLWLSRIVPEDMDQGHIVNLNSLMQDYPTTAQGEYRFIHKDGRVRWSSFRVNSRPDGGVWAVTVVDVDITARKQVEEALKGSEERFRRAFDNAPIGISLIAPNGQFLRANSSYCTMLGYTEAELLQMTFDQITHPADLESDLEGLQQMLTGEIPSFQMEKRYITKQGAVIPVVIRTASVRGEDGQILYFVGHIQDIRDRLKAQRLKDEFISVLSHELRTPLTSIRGALGILRSGIYQGRPEKAERMLNIAVNNSDRLVRLVNDVLDLERLELGNVPLVMQPCQLTDLIQQAIESVQAIADQTSICLTWSAAATSLWVAPDAIIQALTNLLSNAIKFSAPGDQVEVRAEVQMAEAIATVPVLPTQATFPVSDPTVLFSVHDQGRGIPADKLELIFEQFQQVDASDARQKGGSGLGLAICRNIVQLHGGKIWVESCLGKGSIFYFTVPFLIQGEP